MKILFLTNNTNTNSLADWLEALGENVVRLEKRVTLKLLESIKPDLIISYNYRFIITSDIIKLMNHNIINLHISYLPFNKGAYPNIWSILDGTPKGVTIHYIDEGLDTGAIIAQKQLYIPNSLTLEESYSQLHEEIQSLFKEIYPLQTEWKNMGCPQDGVGTWHTKKDFDEKVAPLVYSWSMTGEQLFKLYTKKYGLDSGHNSLS